MNREITAMDVDFNVYYEKVEDEIDITGIYLIDSQVDLIDIVSEEIRMDMEADIFNDEEEE